MRFPIQVFSDYSIQIAFGDVTEYVKRAEELKLPAIALTDYNTLSGALDLLTAVEKVNKDGHKIKPIIGMTVRYLSGTKPAEDPSLPPIPVFEDKLILAKNHKGWLNLVKLCSICRSKERFETYKVEHLIRDDFVGRVGGLIFPKNQDDPVFYVRKEDENLQKIITCSAMKATFDNYKEMLPNHPDKQIIFSGKNLSLEREFSDNSEIYNQIEEFSIVNKPKIPSLIHPSFTGDAPKYLSDACRKGWVEKGLNKLKSTNESLFNVYANRIKDELGVINGAGLSNYMLIIRDIIHKCREDGKSFNIRGSAVGSLVSYLSGITDVDPVLPDPTLPYNPQRCLIFERFINKGRISEGRIALPDIDIDIPPDYRDTLKNWIKNKYGHNKVANIITFGEMKGASALKEAFRVMNKSFDAVNDMTKKVFEYSEARVQDKLEDLKAENPKYNIINYWLDNVPAFAEYYSDFKHEIDIAIRLCNTIRSEGQHAAGIVLADVPLDEFIPTKYDPDSGNLIVAMRMQDVEEMGGVKFDLLNVQTLKIIDEIWRLVEKRKVNVQS